MPEEKVLLKDELINDVTVGKLADCIQFVYEPFDKTLFIKQAVENFYELELKQRITQITKTLLDFLPADFIKATDILSSCVDRVGENGGFVYASFCEYVETYGCSDQYHLRSLALLGDYSKCFSAEFAIRKFMNHYPESSYEKMLLWSRSHDVHQRRLASEGLRPKLPWGKNINFDYKRALLPLNNLYYDTSRYVVRSVANHLNDVSKIDPELVVDILKMWQKTKKQTASEMNYLIQHALRTSVKRGHQESLSLLGYVEKPNVHVRDFVIKNPKILLGEALEFNFLIEAKHDVQLMIDYMIVYPMANGRASSKVFKIKKMVLHNHDRVVVNKKHVFKKMTTKRLYTGDYQIKIQVNGEIYLENTFYLTVD